jgi:GT2 family glycosyltransferase/SAM-dependent methyltransferase
VTSSDLGFTGERWVPGCDEPLLEAEHVARYRFAASALPSGRILDLGCGAGYGAPLLAAAHGGSVIGLDNSFPAALHASRLYHNPVVVADAPALPFVDHAFAAVVALEVLEHVGPREELVAEVRRVLGPRGTAVFSTPNVVTYVESRGGEPNPYHVRELGSAELDGLLAAAFPARQRYGQHLIEAVAIEPVPAPDTASPHGATELLLGRAATAEPDTFVVVCRCEEGSIEWPARSVAVTGLGEFDRLRRQCRLAERDLDEKRQWAFRLRDEVAERDREIGRLQQELDGMRDWALALDAQVRERDSRVRELEDDVRTQVLARRADGPRRQLLLVAALPADLLAHLERVVRTRLAPAATITYLATDRQIDVLDYLRARHEEVIVAPAGLIGLARLVATLRRRRFSWTIVTLAGHRGFTRLKLAGLLAGFPRPLTINEGGDAFFGNPRDFYRHARWRTREWLARVRHDAQSASRLLRESGWRALLRRAAERSGIQSMRRSLRVGLLTMRRSLQPLSFQAADQPQVSIIVPARDNWRLTQRCLRSILDHTSEIPYEVILVDDGSTDATRRAEEHIPGVCVLHLDSSEGYLGACSRGAALARGRFLLFLNNDVAVGAGWLGALLRTFSGRPRCGAAGAKLVYPGGPLQEAGGIVWSNGDAWNFGRGDDPDAPAYNYAREVDYCSGAALIVRREAWEAAGGFDPAYAPGYWEDTDLCFTLRELGWEVWYQPGCVLEHIEGASAGRDERQGMKRFQAVNRERFRSKWAHRLAAQAPLDPRRLFTARDRNDRPVVMVFDHHLPMPDRDAGSVVMDELLSALVDERYRVIFWPENLFRTPGYAAPLQERGVEVVYGQWTPAQYLERIGRRIEVAIAHRARIADQFLPQVRPLVDALGYVVADLEHRREERRGAVLGVASEAAALRRREERLVALVDAIAVHSPVEREVIEREMGARRVVDLPLPARAVPAPADTSGRRDLLFVGSTHPPNVDAIVHFATEVLPLVRRSVGEIEVCVVGKVCERVPELAQVEGVRLLGVVPDLAEWLGRARMLVAPLRFGAGVKGKIVEALAAGLPVVTTAVGAEGLALAQGRSALVASDDADFARSVAALYTDPALWERLRRGGLELAARDHSIGRFRQAVAAFVGELLQAAGSARRPLGRLAAK